MHDDFEPISAIVERLIEAIAPDPGEETEPGAHHDNREGETGVVIWVNFGKGTGAAARGPYMPPRQDFRDRTADGRVGPSRCPPATGGLGNRVVRKR